jgi:hypothetical protein
MKGLEIMDNLTLETKMPIIHELTKACEFLKSVVDSVNISDENFKDNWNEINEILNRLFPDKQCLHVSVTLNIDKVCFGVIVNPVISNIDLMDILLNDSEMSIDKYMVEIDSKIVSALSADDLVMYIIHDIDAITSPYAVTRVRAFMDILMANQEDNIDLKNSINYSNILIYGIKYTMRKLTNLLHYNDEEEKSWPRLADIRANIRNAVPQIMSDQTQPDLSLLQWCLLVYKNLDTEYKDAIEVLTNAKAVTGSELDISEINKLIKSLKRASSELITESSVYENINHNTNSTEIIKEQYLAEKFSLFKNLKKNGLRSIEDDLYEYRLRTKNCTEQSDAIYILRCINTRLSILDDYLANEDITDYERQHWQDVADQYRSLRIELGSKKFNTNSASKNFSNFLNIDYDALDKLDKNVY